jgi:hypothetical protein
MRARVLLALLLAGALGAPAAARADTVAKVHVSHCNTGSRPEDRSATYKAWMRSVPGTERMAMRFKLVVHRAGQSSAEPLSNSQLSVWRRSRAGVTRYVYSQKVKRMEPGSSYRVRVKFRWLDSSGKVIKRATRQSAACAQDGPRPNLTVWGVSSFPGPTPGTAIYGVSVGNPGEGAAEAFTVALFVDGALADARTIEGLEPGERATIDLNGPACKRMRAIVDSDGTVAETDEDDNALVSSC